MTFYVKKSLAHGPIRFGVSPRALAEEIDSDPSLSTGAGGEFLRRRTHGFFFADIRSIGAPEFPRSSSISQTPFWASLAPEDAKGWGLIAMMAFGGLLILLGLMTIVRLGPQGWIPVIFGLALAGTPIGIVAQKRRAIRAVEDHDRAEREERDRRHRESMGAYATALENLRKDPTEANMATATREREKLELSYKHWRPLAKASVLHIGFNALADHGPQSAAEVSKLMDRVAYAVGLDKSDTRDAKVDLYQAIVWHLLADDRLGPTQQKELEHLRGAFGITPADLEGDEDAVQAFERLRGVTRETLPRTECSIPLGFREYCIHTIKGNVLGKHGQQEAEIFLTNKRLVVHGHKPVDVPLSRIDDVEVDTDKQILTVQVARPDPPLLLQVDQQIFTASLIDMATTIDERPRSFA